MSIKKTSKKDCRPRIEVVFLMFVSVFHVEKFICDVKVEGVQIVPLDKDEVDDEEYRVDECQEEHNGAASINEYLIVFFNGVGR